MTLATELRAAREVLGLTRQRLAELAGVSISTIREVERERSDPRHSTVQAIRAGIAEASRESAAKVKGRG